MFDMQKPVTPPPKMGWDKKLGDTPFFAELEFILDWLADGLFYYFLSRLCSHFVVVTCIFVVAQDRSSFHFRFFAGGQFSATILQYKVFLKSDFVDVVVVLNAFIHICLSLARYCW